MEEKTENTGVESRTKKLVLKSIAGQDIEVVVKTAISQHEKETNIKSAIEVSTKITIEGKKPDYSQVLRQEENTMIETLVVSVTGLEKITGEGVKKLIDCRYYPKLKQELKRIVSPLTAKEKKG